MSDTKKYMRLVVILIILAYLGWKYLFNSENSAITASQIESASAVIGLDFTRGEIDSMQGDLLDNLESYLELRQIKVSNSIPPSIIFNPIPLGFKMDEKQIEINYSKPQHKSLPKNRDDLAFYSVRDLGELIRQKQISSVELTQFFLERLKKFGPELECVISLTEELAIKQAKRADREIATGNYRGPLHGIPYGAKDLLAVKEYKTTWGAAPYKEQVIETDASVIKKLEEAGAVLVAKLTLGALAWGDVWYGGQTKNPWDLAQGSSGSSAGSASATAAGLVPFAIGTETWGSIVSPSTRCGTTGLRPTYGRVSRAGAMALSWTMDKIGPICRSTEDCAIVFNTIRGLDSLDQSLFDFPFNYQSRIKKSGVKIGYLKQQFAADYNNKENDTATLNKLREIGFELVPIELPEIPVRALSFILGAEAASAFDELTRSNRDDEMVRQIRNAWPNVFRSSRLIPAVEYIQANRIRYRLIQEMANIFQDVDMYISPSFGGNNLLLTNLTGHPCVVLPNGFNEKGNPTSITFIGNLFDEATILSVSKMYQDATGFHLKHPDKFQ